MRYLVLILFVVSGIRGTAQSATRENCLQCHADLLKPPFSHKPVTENCSKCHRKNGNEHPGKGVKGFTLIAALPELCYVCHPSKGYNKTVHAPVANGKCFACHEVHAGTNKSLLKRSEPDLCNECHKINLKGKTSSHRPVSEGKCLSCHDAHQSDYRKLIKTDDPGMCVSCHEKEKAQLAEVGAHLPFLRNCLICHNGHASDEPHLLNRKTPDLCYSCHEETRQSAQQAAHPHLALTTDRNCMNCHNPHSSVQKKLLAADETTVCLNCHAKSVTGLGRVIRPVGAIIRSSAFIHGAITDGGCTACHLPHGSGKGSLLSGSFPETNYSSPGNENYSLCFRCHDSEMLERELTRSATGFRTGERNLHYLHMHGQKLLNCNQCHDVHGAMNPQLIADKVFYGEWEMPVGFKGNATGGSCTPGCHSEKTYRR